MGFGPSADYHQGIIPSNWDKRLNSDGISPVNWLSSRYKKNQSGQPAEFRRNLTRELVSVQRQFLQVGQLAKRRRNLACQFVSV